MLTRSLAWSLCPCTFDLSGREEKVEFEELGDSLLLNGYDMSALKKSHTRSKRAVNKRLSRVVTL